MRNLSKNLLLHKTNQAQITKNPPTEIGNKEVQHVGNNSYIDTAYTEIISNVSLPSLTSSYPPKIYSRFKTLRSTLDKV
jgi:hypothetical protein